MSELIILVTDLSERDALTRTQPDYSTNFYFPTQFNPRCSGSLDTYERGTAETSVSSVPREVLDLSLLSNETPLQPKHEA